MATKLLGLSGYAQAGKDSVASFLVENYGYTRISFADPLRAALYALNPDIEPEWETPWRVQNAVNGVGWDRAKVEYPEIRALLQRLGTEVGRKLFGENFWVDLAMKQVKDGGKYVFSDVRFPNELISIKQQGGEIWRITRPLVTAVNRHESETALDEYVMDALILNDGSISDLHDTVVTAFTFL